MEKKTICNGCGFVKETLREPIIMTSDILNFLEYEHNKCKKCGHQKDGFTIPVVHKKLQEIANSFIFQRDSIWKFIKEYHKLSEEHHKDVCVKVPRFCKPDYKASGNWETDDIEEPYSWNVVMEEVKHNTPFADTLIREWYRKFKSNS